MLRHSSDTEPGIRRQRMGPYWAYFDPAGKRITDREEIDRLNMISLPPAYTDAWFCTDPDGHLQATGIDARGRKQYRYHRAFRARAEKKKFASLGEFGRALPKLRERVEQDLASPKLTRATVIAAVVRLLDTEHLRVGNSEYAKENKSFGATTLLTRHVRETGHKLRMRFNGKGGRTQEVTITDSRLARIVRKCHDLPGQLLFQYINGDGEPQPISSADVNAYIREIAGGDFTAKHFRTWAASVIAFEKMFERSKKQRKVSVTTIVEPAAEALGNTIAMSRKSYVHPAVIDAVKSDPHDPLHGMDLPRARKGLSASEAGLLAFLEQHAA